jgi:hypothetical protein
MSTTLAAVPLVQRINVLIWRFNGDYLIVVDPSNAIANSAYSKWFVFVWLYDIASSISIYL